MADVSGRRRSRGVSTTVGYILNLTVALLLVTSLLAAAGTFVGDQRERAITDGLQVSGTQLAGALESVDRLAATGDNARLVVSLPPSVAGRNYRIQVRETSLVLTTENPAVRVVVEFQTDAEVATKTVSGGRVVVALDAGANRLEVFASDE